MNLFDLKGRKAIVTGASSMKGLGRAMAQALKENGAEVAVISRSARIFDVAREDGFFALQADLTNRSDLDRAFREAVEKLGTLDILINNHGMSYVHEAISFPTQTWDTLIETNLTSVFLLCQLAAPIMMEKGYGKIINMASICTFLGLTQNPAYVASKAGVGQITKALASEWACKGININAIAPGFMQTDMTEGLKRNPARQDFFFSRIAAGRWGEAADLKGVAVFLSSHASDYIHGAIIPVDGGYLAR